MIVLNLRLCPKVYLQMEFLIVAEEHEIPLEGITGNIFNLVKIDKEVTCVWHEKQK